MEIVREKVLGLLPFADFGAGLPVIELSRLELRSLLAICSTLGNCYNALCCEKAALFSPAATVSGAARVLSHWPSNFFALLDTVSSRRPWRRDIRQQFAPIYDSLFRREFGEHPENLDFFRLAFLDFVSNYWGKRCADTRLMSRLRDAVGRRFVNRAELARSLGVHPRTVALHSKCVAVTNGPDNLRVIDASQFSLAPGAPTGTVLTARKAAAQVGVPVAVLRALKESGHYEAKHILPGQRGYHQLDLTFFLNKLLAAGQAIDPGNGKPDEVVSLGEILRDRCSSALEKAIILRALLARRLGAIATRERSLRDLLIPASEYRAFATSQRSAYSEPSSLACR